ncbi:MAG: TIGR01777 family oxidoreductase [Flavobacteriaceae bacterium]|nr:TIGR01777 family oxidoreductase [Flavobacteriaceae bacterium]
MQKILITGGSGLVGTALSKALLNRGYTVHWLGRCKHKNSLCPTFLWDWEKGRIEQGAFEGVSHIIHLAGANVGAKRWTKSYKKLIFDSRIQSSQLLFEFVKNLQIPLQAFISASAVGYYGTFTQDTPLTEDSPAGTDFLAKVCVEWEKKAQQFTEKLDIRSVCLRTPVVLAENGGALPKIAKPISWGLGAILGSGKQYMPYICLEDLVNLYIKAIEDNSMNGAYNACSSQQLTNEEFTKLLAKKMGKRIWLPNIPSFLLQFLLGEQSSILLAGSPVISTRLEDKYSSFFENM